MASIHKDPRGKSLFWYCAYTLPNGRRVFRSTKQRDRKKALDFCRALEKASEKARAGELTEIQVRKLLDEVLESVGQKPVRSESVRAFFTNWLAGKKLSTAPGIYAHYEKAVTKFLDVLATKADKALSGVTPRDIEAFRDMRLNADGISTGTLVLDLKTVRSVFSNARRQGLVLHNPAEAVELPINRPTARDVFRPEDIRALLRVAPDEWQTLILLGYYLGGRLTDMATLSWASIELANSTIYYQQGKTRAKVEVPIHPDLEARLLAVVGDNPRGLLCPTLARTRVDGRHGLSRQFAKIMSDAGLEQDQVKSARNTFSRKSFHSLRHSFSSALANAGVSADLRMKLTGHKSLAVHQRYSHVELEPLRQAISVLPRLSGEDEG